MGATGSARLPELPRFPAVSVIIPARDCADTLEEAVGSALGQRFDGSLDVAIAAAPSADDTERLAGTLSHDHANVRFVPNVAGTTPAGLNAAIGAARGQVLVRLDAHAELPEDYIRRALELLRETGAANVGGMQVPVGDSTFGRAVAAAMTSPLGAGDARYRVGGEPGDVETVYLGVFRREALEDVGGFDESLVRNQDYELNHRLLEAGHRVYFHPDLAVRYRPRSTPAELWRQYFDYGAWKRRVVRLHPGSLRLRQALPPSFVVLIVATGVVATVGGPVWPVAVIVATYLAALVAGTIDAARRHGSGWASWPLIAFALATMHAAWGVGFLLGRRRGGDPRPSRSVSDAR